MIYVVDKLIGDELSTFTSARYGVSGDLDSPDVKLRQMFDKNNKPKSEPIKIKKELLIKIFNLNFLLLIRGNKKIDGSHKKKDCLIAIRINPAAIKANLIMLFFLLIE